MTATIGYRSAQTGDVGHVADRVGRVATVGRGAGDGRVASVRRVVSVRRAVGEDGQRLARWGELPRRAEAAE